MTVAPPDRPVAALGWDVEGEPWRTTPQWVIHRVTPRGSMLAWAFVPAILFPGVRDPFAPIPNEALSAYRLLTQKLVSTFAQIAGGGDTRLREIGSAPRLAGNDIAWFLSEAPRSSWSDQIPASFEAVLVLGNDLARWLDALHLRQVLHLDVHPDLISNRNRPLGFGVDMRTALPASSRDNRALARSGYAAPELWDASGRGRLGPWTDVYGTAATLFHCLVGEAPPDFRQDLDPLQVRRRLGDLLDQRLTLEGVDAAGLARTIVEGLSPRIEDRPPNILQWAEGLVLPPPIPRAPPSEWDELLLMVSQEASADEQSEPSARMDVPVRDMPTTGKRRRRLVHVQIAMALGFLALGGIVVAASDMVRKLTAGLASVSPLSPATPSPSATPSPAAGFASGTLAKIAYRDDPVRLGAILRESWGAVPAGYKPDRLLMRFREADSKTCGSPLQLHLRADGRGLLIVRPAGLVWVTRWRMSGAKPGDLRVAIDSVWGKQGMLDAPGLVGTSRRIEREGGGLFIQYVDESGRQTDQREAYQLCAANTL